METSSLQGNVDDSIPKTKPKYQINEIAIGVGTRKPLKILAHRWSNELFLTTAKAPFYRWIYVYSYLDKLNCYPPETDLTTKEGLVKYFDRQ